MKNRIHGGMAVAVVALAIGLELPAIAESHAASWSTTYGTMSLPASPISGPIRAPYLQDNGRVVGRMLIPKCLGCGPIIEGIWIENSSSKACSTKKEGSAHWGNVTLNFVGPYSSFTGKWDYCGSGGSRSWTGKLGSSRMPIKNR